MTLFLSYLINGISLGSVYAIIALGYTMVYGIAKMLNFAHGDVIMIGAYIAFCATQYWGFPPALSVVAAMLVCTALGVVIEGLAYKPLRQAASLAVLITAIGMSYLLQNLALLIWGANPEILPFHGSAGRNFPVRGRSAHQRRNDRDGAGQYRDYGGADLLHQQNQDGQGHARRIRGSGRGRADGH